MTHENQPIFLQFHSSPCACGMSGESELLLHSGRAAKLKKSSDFRERMPWSVIYAATHEKNGNKAKSILYPHKFINPGKNNFVVVLVQIKNTWKEPFLQTAL